MEKSMEMNGRKDTTQQISSQTLQHLSTASTALREFTRQGSTQGDNSGDWNIISTVQD